MFLIATLNAFTGTALRAIEDYGWASASAGLFGISAILWVALAAGLKILVDDRSLAGWRRGDRFVAAIVLLAALLPSATASALALTLVSAWAIITGGAGTSLRRAGIIFLAVTGALIWGRLLLALLSRPLLDLDAVFVSSLLGAEYSGNMIWSVETGARVVVAPGCSSMQGMSLALVFWATLNQLFEVRFDRRAALVALAALAATILINVLRMGAMLRWPEHITELHHGWGAQAAAWTTLVLVVAICLVGARHDVFGRR